MNYFKFVLKYFRKETKLMYYPNAHKCVKKLFFAQIATLIATLLVMVPAVLKAIPGLMDLLPVAIVVGAFAVIAFVLYLAGFVVGLIGLLQGGKDSDYIRLAFWINIFLIVVSVVVGTLKAALPGGSTVYAFVDAVSDVARTAIIVYVILGVSQLAASLNNQRLVDRGRVILFLIIAAFVLSIVANIIAHFLYGNATPVVYGLGIALTVTACVFELIADILYFFFLLRAIVVLRK